MKRWLTGLFAAVGTLAAASDAAAAPEVFAVRDGARIHGEASKPPDANDVLARVGQPLRLAALRDETVAFQLVVQAGDAAERSLRVDVEGLAGAPDEPRVERFVEHYVRVTTRSRDGKRATSSLGWNPRARPDDARMLGMIPDALVPIALAPSWAPYPLDVPPHETRAIWIDVAVPRVAKPGVRRGTIVVRQDAREIARIPIELDVRAAMLPFRAVSFFAHYGRGALARVGAGPAAERSLWQLLHAHRVDALAAVNEPGDAERLAPMMDGSLFTTAAGYVGPGEGAPPLLVALGTYGHIGEPTPAHLDFVRDALRKIPAKVREVVLYAADEDCEERTGPAWRQAIAHQAELARVRVLHTCNEDPRHQDVDVVMMTADGFKTDAAVEARKNGRAVWVYNGALPRAGTLLLDADVTSLRASAWIAASRPVGRWFLWETTFWDDDNSGGQGKVDPFATAASFHNKHKDVALLDGSLVYPGDQKGFTEHALHVETVLPSIRLKNLRRGIQDAGLYALARAARPAEADEIVDHAIPAALDEVRESAATQFALDAHRLDASRDALRALVPDAAAPSDDDARRILENAAEERRVRLADQRRLQRGAMAGGGAGAFVLLAVAFAVTRSRRARRNAVRTNSR